MRARYRQAKAARDEAVLQYQAAVLRALQEVADGLLSRQKLAEERVQQAQAVQAYQEAVKISLERYRHGNASYYEILQAQQQLYPRRSRWYKPSSTNCLCSSSSTAPLAAAGASDGQRGLSGRAVRRPAAHSKP